MKCPLCGGPLHIREAERFACERGHEMNEAELEVAVSSRASIAMWMAIEALESEAEALRTLAAASADGSRYAEQAGAAEKDATLLRNLANGHVPPGHLEEGSGD